MFKRCTRQEYIKIICLLVGIIFGILIGVAIMPKTANAAKLGKTQEKRIKQAMEYMTKPETWDKYGIWPSTYLMQTFIESCMWRKPRHGLNGHGEMSGRWYYTVKQAAKGYCQLINKHWYKGAPFMDNSYEQLDRILDCGYCVPRGNYWSKAVRSCEKYGWKKYDKILKKNIKKKQEEEKEKKRQLKIKQAREEEFTFVFDGTLLPWQICGDRDIVPVHSTVRIGYSLLDTVRDVENIGNIIYTGDRVLSRIIVKTKLDNIILDCKG